MQLSIRTQLILIGAAAAAAIAVMVAVLIAVELGSHPRYHYTQDAIQVTDSGYSTGLLTRIFVMLWSAAAGIALFAGAVAHSRPAGRALLAVAALTALVIADDNLLIHEFVSERLGGLLGFEKPPLMQALYGLLLVGVVARFRRPLLTTPWPLLVAAMGFLGASAIMDEVGGLGYYEAGAKYAAILTSMIYLVAASHAVSSTEERPQVS